MGISLSTIKQLQCQNDMKNMEMQSIKSQLFEVGNNYRNKCNKYANIYGDIDDIVGDNQSLQKTLSLQQKLKQTMNELDRCKSEMQSMQQLKDEEVTQKVSERISSIASSNKCYKIKIEQLENEQSDKDEKLQRYETMNDQLSNALRNIRQQQNNQNDVATVNITNDDNVQNEESELEVCQRMYTDQITHLQKQIDAANQQQNVMNGECVKLKDQYNDLYAQNQQLSASKVYLNGIITKQKTKCNKL